MPVKVEVRMDARAMADLMLDRIYSSGAGIAALALTALNIIFFVVLAFKGEYLYMLAFLLFPFLVLAVLPWFVARKVEERMEHAEKLKAPVTYEFDEEGITTTTVDDSGKASWGKFKRAVSRKSVIILYDASKQAVVLPVGQLGENYTAVADMIFAHMPAPAVRIRRTDRKK